MNVKIVDKKESEIRNTLQEKTIKAMMDFKRTLEAGDNSAIKLSFIELLRLGISSSNMNNTPYHKDLDEEKFDRLFGRSIELFMTSEEPLDMESITRILGMFGKVQSTHIMRNFINMNFDLIVRSNTPLSEVPKYYVGRLARARKVEEFNLEENTIRTR